MDNSITYWSRCLIRARACPTDFFIWQYYRQRRSVCDRKHAILFYDVSSFTALYYYYKIIKSNQMLETTHLKYLIRMMFLPRVKPDPVTICLRVSRYWPIIITDGICERCVAFKERYGDGQTEEIAVLRRLYCQMPDSNCRYPQMKHRKYWNNAEYIFSHVAKHKR